MVSAYWRVRTPTVIQMEATECGAASLAIVLGYYGRYVPLEQLRVECGVSRNGSNAYKMVQTAEKHHLLARGVHVTLDTLQNEKKPCILFWQYHHFLVLEGFSKKWVYLNDPNFGPRRITYEEYDQSFTGIAILLDKQEGFETIPPAPFFLKGLIKRLAPFKGPLVYLFLTSALLLIPGLALPAFTRVFVDYFLMSWNLSKGSLFLSAIFFTMSIAALLTLSRQYCLHRLNFRLSTAFSCPFLSRLLQLPIGFYTQRFSGEIAYRMTFNDQLTQSLTGPLASTLLDVVLVGFYAAFLFFYNTAIGLIACASIALSLICMLLLQRDRKDTAARLQQEQGKMAALAMGGLKQIETLKAAGLESPFFARLMGLFTKLRNSSQEVEKKDA
ncbi:MAG: hypothetical protein RL235_520, partial [Chlamydiota bacterium]